MRCRTSEDSVGPNSQVLLLPLGQPLAKRFPSNKKGDGQLSVDWTGRPRVRHSRTRCGQNALVWTPGWRLTPPSGRGSKIPN